MAVSYTHLDVYKRQDLASALMETAKNAVEDNLQDYFSQLKDCTKDSFLEELDDFNIEVIYRRLAANSVAFMLISRCGLDTNEFFDRDDFADIVNFNTHATINAIGIATSDIAEMALREISPVSYTHLDVYKRQEVDTAVRYVVPASQTAPIEWNKVTKRSFDNVLKKFQVTVTKTDAETGSPQGDASLAGAVYGIYKGEELIDTYTTDENGQFTTKYYICDNDWTVREISPSEGYLLDTAIHKVGAEPELYTVELNSTANDVNEQVIKGNIAIIKHTDNGETQIETPEEGAVFELFLKSAGSYENAKETERRCV